VDLGKQKVISFSGKFSSGISEGYKIGFRKISLLAASNGLFKHFTFILQFATSKGF